MSELLKQGLFDALGFLGGTLLGYGLGQLLSIDLFAPGYSLMSLLGIALIGIPGTGKSLTARMIAGLWRLPLLRFDVGSLFGSLAGIALLLGGKKKRGEPMPFGPFLSLGAFLSCVLPVGWLRFIFP